MNDMDICFYTQCALAGFKDPVGFFGEREWFCLDRDGKPVPKPTRSCCTFGERGEPHRIVEAMTIDIDGRAAVNGYFE